MTSLCHEFYLPVLWLRVCEEGNLQECFEEKFLRQGWRHFIFLCITSEGVQKRHQASLALARPLFFPIAKELRPGALWGGKQNMWCADVGIKIAFSALIISEQLCPNTWDSNILKLYINFYSLWHCHHPHSQLPILHGNRLIFVICDVDVLIFLIGTVQRSRH